MELQVFQSEIFEKNFNLNKQFFLQKRPVVVKNDRYVGGGFVFFEILGLDHQEIVYLSLPICKINKNSN